MVDVKQLVSAALTFPRDDVSLEDAEKELGKDRVDGVEVDGTLCLVRGMKQGVYQTFLNMLKEDHTSWNVNLYVVQQCLVTPSHDRLNELLKDYPTLCTRLGAKAANLTNVGIRELKKS